MKERFISKLLGLATGASTLLTACGGEASATTPPTPVPPTLTSVSYQLAAEFICIKGVTTGFQTIETGKPSSKKVFLILHDMDYQESIPLTEPENPNLSPQREHSYPLTPHSAGKERYLSRELNPKRSNAYIVEARGTDEDKITSNPSIILDKTNIKSCRNT